MEESVVKNRLIMILAALAFIFAILWLNTIRSVARQKSLASSKAALVYELEEKNAKLEKERSNASEELKSAKSQAEALKSELEDVKKTLSQEQVAEQALKVELERVSRIKESLEKDLKEALGSEARKEIK